MEAGEPEPDCEACPLDKARLLPENEWALKIYDTVGNRFCRDNHALEMMLGLLLPPVTKDEFFLLFQKLALIHDFRAAREDRECQMRFSSLFPWMTGGAR